MGGKQLSALVEIVWTKLNVVGSGGRVGGMETGGETSNGRAGGDSFGCIGICSIITCDTCVRFDFAEFHVGIGLEIVENIK